MGGVGPEMVVIGLAPSLLSTAGFVSAIYADLALGAPAAVELGALSEYFGKWVLLTFQTNFLCLLYSLLCTAAALWPSNALDAWVVALFPLYFMLALFLTLGYYAVCHFNKAGIESRRLLAQTYPYIYVSKHVSHDHATALAIIMCGALRVAPSYTEVVGSTWPFLIEYLLLTCVNKRLTQEWMYSFLDDAERTSGRQGVARVLLLIMVIGAACAVMGKWMIELRLYLFA